VTLQVRLEAVRLVPLGKAPPQGHTPIGEPAPRRDSPRWNDRGGDIAPASIIPKLDGET
jgi:hypothetical protein